MDELFLLNGLGLASLVFFILSACLAAFGSVHALLNKRDPRSAVAWIAMCVAMPLLGVLLYYMFGKNRIKTRAKRLQKEEVAVNYTGTEPYQNADIPTDYINLSRLSAATSKRPLLTSNQIKPLFNGDQAYPEMLQAIYSATTYIYLATYIFETHNIGADFIKALADAHNRGVRVRVLIDGVGEKYDYPFVSEELKRHGVQSALYLPPTLFPPNLTINLRNHRKLLLVDGCTAFTGGMNIRRNHLRENNPKGFIDLHFQIEGPVLRQLERVFINDWIFAADEILPWNTAVDFGAEAKKKSNAGEGESAGMACRVLLEGPNEDVDKLTWVLVGAISLAQHSIMIMTPYFLPSRELEVALQTAALRGVDVSIVLPGKNNLPFMTWASNHILGSLISTGVKIFHSQGAFVHSKLFVVDDYYVQFGSSNLDPRSLKLNFELAVEVYDRPFGVDMAYHIQVSIAGARPLTEQQLLDRRLWRKVRDAFFWLFSPYL